MMQSGALPKKVFKQVIEEHLTAKKRRNIKSQ